MLKKFRRAGRQKAPDQPAAPASTPTPDQPAASPQMPTTEYAALGPDAPIAWPSGARDGAAVSARGRRAAAMSRALLNFAVAICG